MSNIKDEVFYTFEKVITLEELEKVHIQTAMHRSGGDKATAAKMLGISLKTLYNKLNKHAGKEGSHES
jgi:DNA-binding NtrC family response regulator